MEKTKILKVVVKYRDDKEEEYLCADLPSVSDWVTLYLENFGRLYLQKEAIAEIRTTFEIK